MNIPPAKCSSCENKEKTLCALNTETLLRPEDIQKGHWLVTTDKRNNHYTTVVWRLAPDNQHVTPYDCFQHSRLPTKGETFLLCNSKLKATTFRWTRTKWKLQRNAF